MCLGGYYLYTSGGNTNEARRRAETDARVAREKTLDGAERVGDKIDRAYDDVKSSVESRYKSTKADLQSELNKDKKEIGKQVEVSQPPNPPTPTTKNKQSTRRGRARRGEQTPEEGGRGVWGRGAEVGGRWYGAFGGFGGTGIYVFVLGW
jgi:hypothetical protein